MTQTPIQRKLVRTAAGFTRKAVQHGQVTIVSAEDLARIYLAADGRNTIDNVVLSCLTDNRQKYTMSEAQYRDWLALDRVCPVDGKHFKPRPADYRRGLGFYCSRRCSGKIGGQA